MQMQYFDIKEFDCQETGTNEMNPFFLEKLDQLRHQCGFPFKITSGYRDPLTQSKLVRPDLALMLGVLLLTSRSTAAQKVM